MNWAILIPIIAQYGLPLAEKLWTKLAAGNPVTQADWDELNAMTQQNATAQMQVALTNAGIPLTDPHAVALLALTK